MKVVRSFPSPRLYSAPPGTINAALSREPLGVSQGVFITVGEGGREEVMGGRKDSRDGIMDKEGLMEWSPGKPSGEKLLL